MNLKCYFGFHSWDKIQCKKCGKINKLELKTISDLDICEKDISKKHNWTNDCKKCSNCGQTRDLNHDWSEDCQKCKICGKTNTIKHQWKDDNCEKCNKIRIKYAYPETISSHQKIFNYLKFKEFTGDLDEDLEDLSLNKLNFNSLSLAIVLIYCFNEKQATISELIEFLEINPHIFENLPIAILIKQLSMLSNAFKEAGFIEINEMSILLIKEGAIGNKKAILPIPQKIDKVKNMIERINTLLKFFE